MPSNDPRTVFLDRVADVIGEQNVVRAGTEGDYRDPFPLVTDRAHWPGVKPGSVDEVQAVLAIATETGVPVWTTSRGKNLGYGGPEPRRDDTVVLDLGRMNRIIEVNEELCYAIVEPGVTFFDLFDYIQQRDLDLFISVPALGWGSVMGNALDRGYGMSPMGDHFASTTGMEVVLATGELVRTGMWAMNDTPLGAVFKGGYGPNLEGLFSQSNLGVVTKIGLHLMRWPKTYFAGEITVERQEDLPRLIDLLTELRREDVLQNNALCGNVVRRLTMTGPRDTWYTGEGAIPDERLEELRLELGVGQWNCRFALYGDRELVERRWQIVQERFADFPGAKLKGNHYSGKDGARMQYDDIAEIDRTQMSGLPSLGGLDSIKWYAENGGHIDCAPIIPASGELVYEFYREVKDLYAKYGFDIYIGYHLYARHMVHVTMIFFDKDDEEQLARARTLYLEVLHAARRHGYAPYRSHVDYMDEIARGFDFNGGAVLHLQETLKDALDPAGILSPGKQGVWPARLRDRE